MEKEFVPYQQALEFKNLGFDEPCFGWYSSMEGNPFRQGYCETYSGIENCAKAPLYQQAFRWFREKYNIDAWVQPFMMNGSKLKPNHPYLPDESYSYWIFRDGVWVDDKADFDSPEEAELACIKKIIEIIKNK
jgi:hypothetical protein